jgi:hypothetical protein
MEAPSSSSCSTHICRTDVSDISTDNLSQWEVELVDGGMHWVVLDSSEYVESCLLKPQGEPTHASEQVDRN